MTAFLVLAVWFAASLLAAAGYVVLRRAASRAARAAALEFAAARCSEHGHACQPHDHQPGSAR